MFTKPEKRGKGIASNVLIELENWVKEMNYKVCILETCKKQLEAIRLHGENGHKLIPNYVQYKGMNNSGCYSLEIKKMILKKVTCSF